MSIAEVLSGDRLWWVGRGDTPSSLAYLPDDSVDLLFCSPPYEDARLYLEGGEDIGIARKTDAWVAWMLTVCREARRVCKGLCAFVVEGKTSGYRYTCSPFLLLADLCREGFNLRKPPIYRRVGIPGSGGPDWLRNDWEPIICFTKPGRLPWSDNVACGHEPKFGVGGEMSNRLADGRRINDQPARVGKHRRTGTGALREYRYQHPEKANPGNVIDCTVGGGRMGNPLASNNEAPFPESLAEFFVLSFCPPGGIVCDPFSGSGTTVAMALRHGRRGIGFDLRPSQVELSRRRIATETPSLFTSTAATEGKP